MGLFIFSEMLLSTTLFVLVAIPVEYADGAEYESVRHFSDKGTYTSGNLLLKRSKMYASIMMG